MVMDAEGMPRDIVVADHTGTFNDYACPLAEFTVKYALPVTRRRGFLPDADGFARAYCAAFEERLQQDPGRLPPPAEGLRFAVPAPARAGARELLLPVEEGARPPG